MQMKIAIVKTAMLAGLALQGLCMPAYSQLYPSKPMRIAVGFPAGGPADTMTRIIGKKMTDIGGQLIVVENRPGANGFIAGDYVARSAPDGYTSWFSSGSTLSFTKYLYSRPLLDPDRDLSLVEDVQAFRTSEARKWGDLIRKINLKLE